MGFSWGLCGARMGFVRGSFASRFGKGEIHEAALGSCEVGVGLAGSWCGVLHFVLIISEPPYNKFVNSWGHLGVLWGNLGAIIGSSLLTHR